MRNLFTLFIVILLVSVNFAVGQTSEPLKFKAKIGFVNGSETIQAHSFIENGKKLVLIGTKTLQVWDVDRAILLNSASHQIPQFEPKGFVSDILLLGLPKILAWRPYVIDPAGKWIITIESVGNNKTKSAVVRNLTDTKTIAILDLPNSSSNQVALEEKKNEIITMGKSDKTTEIGNWDKDGFKLKKVIRIEGYELHKNISNDEKVLVVAGEVEPLVKGRDTKQRETLTLRDSKTGVVETEYTAKDLLPQSNFQETIVTSNEKYLISRRDDRIFVWAVRGDGNPLFEIVRSDPKDDIDLSKVIADRYLAVNVNKNLSIYDIEDGGKVKFTLVADKPNDTVSLADATLDGRFIAVAQDEKVSVLATDGDGKPVYELTRGSISERFTGSKFLDEKNYFTVSRANRKEKKGYWTEFYEIATGKKILEIPAKIGNEAKFLRSGALQFEDLGGSFIWNFDSSSLFRVPLEISDPDDNTIGFITYPPSNIESVALSPDENLIVRYGGDIVSVFDVQTKQVVQELFDADNAKYTKLNKLKKSRLGDASWSENGKQLYVFDGGLFMGSSKTVSIWERVN